jgi:hypothetical protein
MATKALNPPVRIVKSEYVELRSCSDLAVYKVIITVFDSLIYPSITVN